MTLLHTLLHYIAIQDPLWAGVITKYLEYFLGGPRKSGKKMHTQKKAKERRVSIHTMKHHSHLLYVNGVPDMSTII